MTVEFMELLRPDSSDLDRVASASIRAICSLEPLMVN